MGISTSIDPTLCGPVYAGKAGVGLIFLSHVIFASAVGFAALSGRENGVAERRDWTMRVSDSLLYCMVYKSSGGITLENENRRDRELNS